MKPPIRILLVDDETPARQRMRTLLSDIAAECPHELVGEAANAQEAIMRAEALRAELVLLDVQMPGTDGMTLATRLAALPQAPALVFVTAHDEFALQAFDLQACDYLLKPVRASRLAQALRRAGELRKPAPAARQFSVQEKGRVLLVPARQVLFLKADLKYVSLHTAEGEYLIEDSLQSIEDEMPDLFIRVHRSALAAREAIMGVERAAVPTDGEEAERESWVVILRGTSERLPVSRRQWAAVKALLR